MSRQAADPDGEQPTRQAGQAGHFSLVRRDRQGLTGVSPMLGVDGVTTDHFPRLQGRDLTGRTRRLPDAFGERLNLVFVAFRRDQQAMIDSWATWLGEPEVASRLAFCEIPILGRQWAPMRPVIDGGMAAAVRDEKARRRTMTVYGNVGKIAEALGISDRSTVSIFLVNHDGHILDRATGPFDEATAARFAEQANL